MNDSVYPIETLSFPTNLDEELETYISISNKNLETFNEMVDFICSRSGVELNDNPWVMLKELNNDYNSNLKLIERYEKDITNVEADVKILQKKDQQELNSIHDVKDLIEECVTTLKELTLDKEETHKTIINRHNALKLAIYYYKISLDLYIHVKMEENVLVVKVCFFTKTLDDKYSLLLQYNTTDSTWKLLGTNPKLPDFQYAALDKRLYETNNVSALVSTVRKIFKIIAVND